MLNNGLNSLCDVVLALGASVEDSDSVSVKFAKTCARYTKELGSDVNMWAMKASDAVIEAENATVVSSSTWDTRGFNVAHWANEAYIAAASSVSFGYDGDKTRILDMKNSLLSELSQLLS